MKTHTRVGVIGGGGRLHPEAAQHAGHLGWLTGEPEPALVGARIDLKATQVFAHLDGFIRPGVSTLQINDRADAFIVEVLKARPVSKGQYGFAYSLNTSVDHVVCHGVPSAQQVLAAGSIINVDITLEHGGYIADSSKMYRIGAIKQVVPAAFR